MENFNKENPYSPNSKYSTPKKGLPKLSKPYRIILLSLLSIIILLLVAAFITAITATPEEVKARKEKLKEIDKQEKQEEEKERLKELKKITDSKTYSKLNALVGSQTYIEGMLKSPGSAKFDSSLDGVIQINDTTFTVKSYVDSQNGFGALLRTHYSCKVVFHRKDDTYNVENVTTE